MVAFSSSFFFLLLLVPCLVGGSRCTDVRVLNFSQPVDHFTYALDASTFEQRYIVCDPPAPPRGILFYAGNEGDIEGFATASGFVWDLAGALGCTVLFAEHRYYGTSVPAGPQWAQLSSQQALTDFVLLATAIRAERNDIPLIAIGN
jgi:hypothetical protein